MVSFNFGRALGGLSQGLLAAGGQGWGAFGPGMLQGQQLYDQQQQQAQQQKFQEISTQLAQQRLEDERTANTQAAAADKAWHDLLSGQGAPSEMASGAVPGDQLAQVPPGLRNGGPGGMPLGPGLMQGVQQGQGLFSQVPQSVRAIAATLPRDEGINLIAPFFKPNEADKPLVVGGVVIDPKDPKHILADYSDVLQRNAAAGKTSVSVSTPAPMVLGDKDASGFVRGTLENWQKQGQGASEAFTNLQQIRSSLDNGLQTGAFASPREYLAKVLQGLGADESSVDSVFKLSDAKLFTSASKGLVLAQIKSLGANPSNADVKFLEATLPNVNDSPQAARAVADWLSDKYEDQMDRYQMGYSVYQSGKDPVEWDAKMTRYWAVPRKDRQALMAHPEDKEAFDSVYGKGAADLILSVGQ